LHTLSLLYRRNPYTREDEVHADGWIQDYGAAGNRLYINADAFYLDSKVNKGWGREFGGC